MALEDTGPSLAEQMIMKGCRWRPSDRSKGSHVSIKNEIHEDYKLMSIQSHDIIFNSCTNLVSVTALPIDKKNPEDIDTHSEDHLYDALRYGIMSDRFSIFDYDPMGRPSGGMQVADSLLDINMEIIWTLLLTVCSSSSCATQTIRYLMKDHSV